MPFDPNKIPIWLRRTPEQAAADLAYQDTLKQALGPRRRPNATERHLLRAAAVKRSAFAQLDSLRRSRHPDARQIAQAEAQMADALAMEGNFTEAARLHPKAEYAERYQAIADAIERDDSESTCNCPVERQTNDVTKTPTTITGEIVSEMVFSPKHNRMMPLLTCARCGGMNVRAAGEHLEERLRKVREVHQQAKQRRGA